MKESSVSVEGVDLGTRFGAFLMKDTELPAPEPKTYTVDIPCGVDIDLTSALTGDTAYESREMKLALGFRGFDSWERLKSEVWSMLHGRRLSFELGCDPGYTYTGRWNCTGVERYGRSGRGTMTFTVTADPYKLKEHCMYRLNATGGKWYRFESGRRPVHPVIECDETCWITWNGIEYTIPAGAYRLNDVLFTEGANDLYVNTCRLWSLDWSALAQGAAHAMTWSDATAYTWDDLQRLGIQTDAPQSWDEIAVGTWSGLAQKTWAELDYRNTEGGQGSADVYLSYDWEDL